MIALVLGALELHRFPDGEVRARIAGAAAGRTVGGRIAAALRGLLVPEAATSR